MSNNKEFEKKLEDWFKTRTDKINDPSRKVRIGNETFTMRQIREMEERYKINENKDSRFDVLIFWDDVVQCTSLGLIDILINSDKLSEELKTKLKNFKIVNFFHREEVEGIDLVYNLVKDEMSKDELLHFFKKNYAKTFLNSPLTPNISLLSQIGDISKSITIVFRYNVKNVKEIINDMYKKYYENKIKKPLNLRYSIIGDNSKDVFYDFYPNKDIDFVITNDAGAISYHILVNELEDCSILTPTLHNNLNEIMIGYYMDLYDGRITPYNTKLFFYHDEIHGYESFQEEVVRPEDLVGGHKYSIINK